MSMKTGSADDDTAYRQQQPALYYFFFFFKLTVKVCFFISAVSDV